MSGCSLGNLAYIYMGMCIYAHEHVRMWREFCSETRLDAGCLKAGEGEGGAFCIILGKNMKFLNIHQNPQMKMKELLSTGGFGVGDEQPQ